LSIDEVGGAVTRGVGQASNSMHNAIDKATGIARPAVDQVAAGVHHAVDRLADAANHAAQSIEAKSGQLRAAQSRATETVLSQIRERPLASLGAAVAVGFLLSWLLRLR
jgi:ElaB/YqjD/DUF883 family membrane-anchored ribosome-binding protein